MQFNGSSTQQDLVHDTLFLCGGVTTAAYPLVDITRNINQAYHDVTRLIWESQDGWQFDDANQTDLPKLIVTLTHGTEDYRVHALSTVLRHIKGIEVQDTNGNWQKLNPIDYHDVSVAWQEYRDTAGMPIEYDLEAGYIRLKPAPSSAYCTLSSGMVVWMSRYVTEFTTGSTTSIPGFASQFHRILSYSAALDFEKDPVERARLIQMRDRLEKGLQKFYSGRNVERQAAIKPYGKRRWRTYL